MKLYNTLSRQLEEFTPLNPPKVTFYHCGPTVYWTQHIGNLRGMTMGDLLVRAMYYLGYEVVHVRNYTDVGHLTSDRDTGEDKMEKGAVREGLTPDKIAEKYIKIFESDTLALNLLEPKYKPRPSKLIPDIISMVKILIDKDFAYATDLAVYFDTSKFPDYTKLSKQDLEKSLKGEGKGEIEDVGKRHFADFALWIFKAGNHINALQTWESPFVSKLVDRGRGFPGWHIECSVMSKKYLGDTIDIHMGGVEHIPIHHTNEIAQSESANGVKFVRYWLHNEHLVVNQEKMAKSQGTGMSLSELTDKGYDPLSLRYFFLQAHYRSRQNFTFEALDAASQGLSELRRQVRSTLMHKIKGERQALSDEKMQKIDAFRNRFDVSVSNDLNIPQALAITWEVLKSNIPPADKYDLIIDFDRVLGLNLHLINIDDDNVDAVDLDNLPDNLKQLIRKRQELRSQRKFKESDAVRVEIEQLGYIIEDKPDGFDVKKKSIY